MVDASRRGFFRGRPRPKAENRPPWALAEALFVDRCTRCNDCLSACPEHILVASDGGFPTVDFKRGGQRVGTVVMYLNEPEKGGGTSFPDVHFEVAPKRGNAVFFSYDRPHAVTRSLHGGAPVVAGEKWVATKWLREGEFI